MQDKIVGAFEPFFAEKNKNRVYMSRLEKQDTQNKCSPQCFCDGSCKKENLIFYKNLLSEIQPKTPYLSGVVTEPNEAMEKQSNDSKSFCEQKDPIKALEELFMGMKLKETEESKNSMPLEEQDTQKKTTDLKSLENVSIDWQRDEPKRWINEDVKNFDESFTDCSNYIYNPTEGIKHNEDKLPLDIVLTRQFPKALNAVCQATMFGHNKYKDTDTDFLNFKKVLGGSQTYADALQRHSVNKGTIALDSGLPHIFHKCWNALAELELWIEENKFGSLK